MNVIERLIHHAVRRGRCEYFGGCSLYSPDSYTCNVDPGPYCGAWRGFKATEDRGRSNT